MSQSRGFFIGENMTIPEEILRIIKRLTEQVDILSKRYDELLEEFSMFKASTTIKNSLDWNFFYETETIREAYKRIGEG